MKQVPLRPVGVGGGDELLELGQVHLGEGKGRPRGRRRRPRRGRREEREGGGRGGVSERGCARVAMWERAGREGTKKEKGRTFNGYLGGGGGL